MYLFLQKDPIIRKTSHTNLIQNRLVRTHVNPSKVVSNSIYYNTPSNILNGRIIGVTVLHLG